MAVAAIPQLPYWSRLARTYGILSWPLRPSQEDLRLFEATALGWAAKRPGRPVSALMLGVTRDIALMRWPPNTRVLGIDNAAGMVKGVWPGNVPGRRIAVHGDWRHLPRPDCSCDIVIGDGSLNCVRHPRPFLDVAASVRRVLRADGIFILRCYVQSEKPETPDELFDAIFAEPIRDFHHFKFRLLMAMQHNVHDGVRIGDVFDIWTSRNLNRARLITELGWGGDEIETMDNYRGGDTVHSFPTLEEFREGLREFFGEPEILTPSAPLGVRCPILVMRPLLAR